MMNDEELRFALLQEAVRFLASLGGGDPIGLARDFYDFVRSEVVSEEQAHG